MALSPIQDAFEALNKSALTLDEGSLSPSHIASKWIGNPPATPAEIQACETRLGCRLPDDYRQLITLANGFAAPNDLEPSFAPLSKIDRLSRIDPDLIDAYSDEALADTHEGLISSLLVGGFDEDQYFLLLCPTDKIPHWRYWKFANWIPGEEPYASLIEYFQTVTQENFNRANEA